MYLPPLLGKKWGQRLPPPFPPQFTRAPRKQRAVYAYNYVTAARAPPRCAVCISHTAHVHALQRRALQGTC